MSDVFHQQHFVVCQSRENASVHFSDESGNSGFEFFREINFTKFSKKIVKFRFHEKNG